MNTLPGFAFLSFCLFALLLDVNGLHATDTPKPSTRLQPLYSPELIEKGHQLFTDQCSNCHGVDDYLEVSPSLFQQNPIFLRRELRKFALPADHPESRLDRLADGYMNFVAPELTEQDIDAIVAYVSTVPNDSCHVAMNDDIHLPAELILEGKKHVKNNMCFSCHRAHNKWDAPKIKGQNYKFLFNNLFFFKNMQRNSQFMNGLVKTLSSTVLTSIAAYLSAYSSCLSENEGEDYD